LENSYLEDEEGNGTIILRWEKCDGEVGRLKELAQDRVQCQSLVLTVLNLRVLPPHCGTSPCIVQHLCKSRVRSSVP